jgi:hypothetical protein
MRISCVRRLLALAAVVASDVSAQIPDSTRRVAGDTSAPRPFVRGGIYDKPHQTRLFGRIAVGGYAEAHARYQRVDGLRDESGFEAKRFNLFANTLVSDWVRLGSELEFEDGAQEIVLEYAAIDVRVHPSYLTIRGGMVLAPLGRFNLAHDSPLNEFTDRPLVSTDLIGVALSEPGFGLFGQLPVGRAGRMTYEAYATNGFHDGLITDSEDGTRIPRGRRNFEDNNGSPAVVGRVAWSPRIGFEIGASAHHGAYNVFNEEGAVLDKRRNVTIGVLDAEATIAGIHLTGEGAVAGIDVPEGLRGIYSTAQRGLYLEAVSEFGRGLVRTMPQSSFAAKVRWDYLDFDTGVVGTSTAQLSAGVNFRPTMDSVLKLDFVRGRRRDEFNNLGEHAYVLFSLATYF